jgi:DNA primase
MLEEAVQAYERAVTPQCAAYLHERGISEGAAATFRLGVVADPVPGHERFEGWLAIPYLDRDGLPLSVRFRCIHEHDHRAYSHGKYMSMVDEPSRVFNVRAIHEADDTIHVTEGEMDAIVLNQIGLPAVAIPGAVGFQPHHRRMLAGFSRVWVWGDPDEAGGEFTARVTRALRGGRGVRLRNGDVNETYLREGAEGLLALVNEGSV